MVWYVAFVALLNLGMGYAVAVYLAEARRQAAARLAEEQDQFDAKPGDYTTAYDELPAADAPAADDVAAPIAPSDAEIAVGAVTAETEAPSTPVQPNDDAPAAKIPANELESPTASSFAVDPSTGLMTREQMEQLVADLAIADAGQGATALALVEIESLAAGDDSLEDRLLVGVAKTVQQLLTDVGQVARFSDRQLLMVLGHEDLEQASQRAETLRHRVAATEYLADDRPLRTTLTCALGRVSADMPGSHLLEYLEETLDEAKRYGGNRTFLHDGESPAPVVPTEMKLAPQKCAI